MQLNSGYEEEYRRRHDEIWPELRSLLKASGISEYAIFLQPGTGRLFGFLKAADDAKLDELPQQPIMKKWWSYMKDIMQTNEDDSPVSIALKEVFYLL